MNIYSPTISGSLTISGSIITTGGGLPLTGSLVSSGSFTSIGSSNLTGSVFITGSTGVNTLLQVGSSTSASFFISSSGNVGINTTSSIYDLQIGSRASVSTATPDILSLGGTYSSTAGSNVKLRVYDDVTGNSVGGMSVSSGQMEVNTWSSGKIAFYRSTTQSAIIDASGRFGIGINAPSASLQVGNATSNAANRSTVAILSAASASAVLDVLALMNTATAANGNGTAINFHNAGNYAPTAKIEAVQDMVTASSLRFYTYEGTLTEKVRITSSGSVGIGTTSISNGTVYGGGGQVNILKLRSAGYTALEINSDTSGGSLQFTYGSNLPNQVGALIGYNYASGTVLDFNISNVTTGSIILATSGSERMRITSSGSIGIGTSSPSGNSKVEISAGESIPTLRLTRTTFAGYGSQLHFSTTGSNRFAIGLNPSDDLYFDRDTTGIGGWNPTTLVIQRLTGNVGIGTSNPSYALDINNNGTNIGLRINQPSSTTSYYNTIYFTGNHTSVVSYIGTGGSTTANTALRDAYYLGTYTSHPIVFTTGDSEKLRIDSSGNITWLNTTTPLNLKPENTYATAISSLSSASSTYNQKPGVYWLNYGGQIFLAYVKFNWHQGRNWVLALKCHNTHDMPSGSPLWQNNTLVNQGDFNLNNGRMAKYPAWNYFAFTRVLVEMGNRIPPIMQWNSSKTSLYSVFSAITPSNGSGLAADSTDPAMTSSPYFYDAGFLYKGPSNFPAQSGGQESVVQMYGLGSFANNSNNSTSAANTGETGGFGITGEHLGAFTGLQSVGRSGAWIGCPLDEGAHTFNAGSNSGADSGFGLGVSGGNNARTATSGVISWATGNNVINFLPAYVWLSID